MSPSVRAAAVVLAAAVAAPAATAASPEQIEAAIARGARFLKDQFKGGEGGGQGGHGIGPAALGGIALIEARTPADDPTLKAVAAAVRERAYGENQTYQVSLCLLFLDRLEDKADVPLIQLLGVRLLAGQNARGGWTYQCAPNAGDEVRLRAGLKGPLPPGKDGPKGPPGLHPLVQEYANTVLANRGAGGGVNDDNSNTQFAVLALWVARRHGVPTDPALDLIERRFMTTQDAQGGWPYASDGGGSTPSMTCAGLLGLATAIGRREEKRAVVAAAKDPEPAPAAAKSNDPFFNPPPRADGKAPPAAPKKAVITDARDAAAARGFAALGPPVAAAVRGLHRDNHGLYFLWSVERVGVLFGHDRIGGVDWYALGSDLLVRAQGPKGEWYAGAGADIDTSFAVLFLCKANLARDLSSRLGGGTELRAGTVAPETTTPTPKGPVGPVNPLPLPAPAPTGPAGRVQAELVRAAGGADWAAALATARDAKGGEHTVGLAAAIYRLDGDKKKEARDALADRLFRMTAATLKALMASPDREVRRGAVLAAAMRDDAAHVPDLIDKIADPDELVARAARAGLRSLTGQDHGPTAGATPADRQRAAAAWRAWWATQKR